MISKGSWNRIDKELEMRCSKGLVINELIQFIYSILKKKRNPLFKDKQATTVALKLIDIFCPTRLKLSSIIIKTICKTSSWALTFGEEASNNEIDDEEFQ